MTVVSAGRASRRMNGSTASAVADPSSGTSTRWKLASGAATCDSFSATRLPPSQSVCTACVAAVYIGHWGKNDTGRAFEPRRDAESAGSTTGMGCFQGLLRLLALLAVPFVAGCGDAPQRNSGGRQLSTQASHVLVTVGDVDATTARLWAWAPTSAKLRSADAVLVVWRRDGRALIGGAARAAGDVEGTAVTGP